MKAILRNRLWSALALMLAVPLLCLAAKEFSMPKTQPAFSYAAHDHHAKENVTVGLDPYDDPAKAKIFTINYRDNDLLPILLVITNDSDEPIQLSDMTAELVTADRAQAESGHRRRYFATDHSSQATGARVPIPFPTKRVKGGMNPKELERNSECAVQGQSRRAAQLASRDFCSSMFPA